MSQRPSKGCFTNPKRRWRKTCLHFRNDGYSSSEAARGVETPRAGIYRRDCHGLRAGRRGQATHGPPFTGCPRRTNPPSADGAGAGSIPPPVIQYQRPKQGGDGKTSRRCFSFPSPSAQTSEGRGLDSAVRRTRHERSDFNRWPPGCVGCTPCFFAFTGPDISNPVQG